jgi:hypothetical protein
MDVSESEGSCTITWNPHSLTLDDLAKLTSLLADLHSEVAVPYVIEDFTQPGSNVVPPKSPLVASIRMGSPLVAELLSGRDDLAIAAVGMVGWILKNPDKLAGFLPVLRSTWHRENRIAEEEKFQRTEEGLWYVESRARVQTRGRSIQRFERELARERESPRTRKPRMGPDDRPGRAPR